MKQRVAGQDEEAVLVSPVLAGGSGLKQGGDALAVAGEEFLPS